MQKWKKTPRDIIILHKCTIIDNHMIYHSWDINCNTDFFCHLGPFFAFYPPNCPKNENIKKNLKTPGDVIILHKSTKNHDHMLYCPWDMTCDRWYFYFSYWAIFCPFTPFTTQKINISQKWKKHMEISSFYMCVPKMKIRWCTFPKIWCTTGGQADGQMDEKSDRGGCPT